MPGLYVRIHMTSAPAATTSMKAADPMPFEIADTQMRHDRTHKVDDEANAARDP
jgi:hypothetical protein